MAAHVANHAPARTRRPAALVGDPILTSKITAPDVPAWAVQRPRITELIAEGARWCQLTVVTGPPGAGKTMAVALWAAAETGPVAWVGLDEFDNGPGTFWSYAVAALRRSGVALPKELRALPHGRDHDDEFLLRLTAALAAQDPPVTLVLDDLHLLTDPGVLKGLDFMLRNAGSALRVVVTSRVDPLLPLHRYRLAGQVTEIRASDLAFSITEAGLLLAQHGSTLTADSLECLTQRTEGWAAGLRLAAISLSTHPDPGQFVKELVAEDSPLICYLVDEVLNVQPPQVREVLLSTCILEHFSADAAAELTGDEQAAGVLASLARTNAFVQPIGCGWYRYHTLFAEMLRLKLRYEHPDRVALLLRRAARWYQRKGLLADAVRQAARAGDWPLAAAMVIDELAIGQLIDPCDGQRLAAEFAGLPSGRAWAEPAPYLVTAALALVAGQHESCAAALDAADCLLDRLPAEQDAAGRLSAAVVRLGTSLRAGDLTAAASAADHAEPLLNQAPGGKLARHPELRRRVLSGRAAVELWSGHLEEAARVLEAGLAAEVTTSGREAERAERAGRAAERAGWAGQLALAEALRGRLSRAAELASQAVPVLGERRPAGQHPDATPLVALAWVHLERNELHEARSFLKQADAALGESPDKLIGTVAYLVAAGGALAEGRPVVAAQIVTRARSGWPVPAWLDHQLSLVESRAWAAGGDVRAALAAAGRAGASPEAAVTLAHAWAVAGDGDDAVRVLAPVLADCSHLPESVRLHAWLTDARLHYASGDAVRGRRTLVSVLRLAEREQLRLPLALERSWLWPVLRRDPELADAHRRLLAPVVGHEQLPAPVTAKDPAPELVLEPLTERELEVLTRVSGMLNTAEVASEMYISVNTVKTHLRNIYRKLSAAHRNEAVRRARQLQLI
ncbi:MAG TPA: LuxR C-terminal-related transcriptional regulator [Streptosporangiaceae bacterium]|nr:LuxR C-terminal-related transcriptional regulator [Streptosporangiaceae bacterium]